MLHSIDLQNRWHFFVITVNKLPFIWDHSGLTIQPGTNIIRNTNVNFTLAVEKGSVDIKNGHSTPSESLVKKETSEHVRHAIAGLPPEQREAITLKQYHDLSYLQISEVLDCSLEKVKILIFRAKEQLRIELASFILEEQR